MDSPLMPAGYVRLARRPDDDEDDARPHRSKCHLARWVVGCAVALVVIAGVVVPLSILLRPRHHPPDRCDGVPLLPQPFPVPTAHWTPCAVVDGATAGQSRSGTAKGWHTRWLRSVTGGPSAATTTTAAVAAAVSAECATVAVPLSWNASASGCLYKRTIDVFVKRVFVGPSALSVNATQASGRVGRRGDVSSCTHCAVSHRSIVYRCWCTFVCGGGGACVRCGGCQAARATRRLVSLRLPHKS